MEMTRRHPSRIGVAETKRRFSDLLDEIGLGNRFIILRRGRAAAALVAPELVPNIEVPAEPIGLAAIAGALADWDELDDIVEEIYRSRKRAKDREVNLKG